MMRHLLLGACLVALALPATAKDGGHVVQADNTPLKANWDLSSDDAYLGSRVGCFESLTRVSNDIRIEPALATEWRQTNPTTWEFKIREGVKFHDGADLDAKAVANALQHRLKAPVPARAFSPKSITSVEATGPFTVTITTAHPVVTLPGQLASPATTILSPAAYATGEVNPLGTCTGPFEITEIDTAQHITVKRFDGYWGGAAKLDSGQIRFIPDANTRGTMARTGEAQVVRMVPPHMVAQFQKNSDLTVSAVQAPRVTELLINNAREPLNDARVRQAIRYAIDTATLSAAAYEGLAEPAGSPFRAGDPWAPSDAPPVTRDLDRARALLDEAGVDPSTLKFTILAYTSRTELADVAVILQSMLGDLGIEVDVRVAEYYGIEPDLLSGNYDMALLSRGYLTDVPEPIGFLTADYTCEGSYNISQYCNEEVDDLVKAAAGITDPEERYATYAKVAQKLYDDAVTINLINETLYDVASNSVENYEPHPMNYYVFTTRLAFQ